MMIADSERYLPDDILVKVDRASMHVSLEVRAPLLDYRVIEFAWRVPFALKVQNGQAKWLLKHLLSKHIPPELVHRPKMGFDVPIANWLREGLRDWAEDLLSDRRLREDGFFDPLQIRKVWSEHLSGKRNNYQALWTILMFQSWLETIKGSNEN
jgi:asparagine synthase (glutamine-hydrolysing)